MGFLLRTNIFELYKERFKNISELARTMGISVGYLYKVKQGKRGINSKFIIGAKKVFPGYTLDDLFYIASDRVGRND